MSIRSRNPSQASTNPLPPRAFENNVLVHNSNSNIYYLPCYMRIKFKELLKIDIEKATGTYSATLFFTIYYKGISKYLDRLQNGLSVLLNNSQTITLNNEPPCAMKLVESKHQLVFMYRGSFEAKMGGNLFFTPFERQTLTLTISLNAKIFHSSLHEDQVCPGCQNPKFGHFGDPITIKFNFMEYHRLGYPRDDLNDLAEAVCVETIINKGQYGVIKNQFSIFSSDSLQQDEAHEKSKRPKSKKKMKSADLKKMKQEELTQKAMAEAAFEVERERQQQMQKAQREGLIPKKLKQFHHVTFQFQVYRFPLIAMLLIFMPMWILTAVNICVYFAANNLGVRLQTLSGVMVAFLAFLPTIRSRIPPTANFNLIDIQTYSLICTTLLVLLQSTLISTKDYQMLTWNNDPFFITTVVVICLSIAVTAVQVIHYKFYLYPRYNRTLPTKSSLDFEKRNNFQWKNEECRKKFKPYTQIVSE